MNWMYTLRRWGSLFKPNVSDYMVLCTVRNLLPVLFWLWVPFQCYINTSWGVHVAGTLCCHLP